MKCHTVRGIGGQVGPDLSVIGKKASRENLYESILLPSKAIADQYLQWKIDKADGISITGIIVAQTPTSITLRNANAKDTTIDLKDIDTRTKLAVSIMPENIASYMNEDELTDVVEYLFSLKTPVVGMDWWHIAGPFDNGIDDAGLDHGVPAGEGHRPQGDLRRQGRQGRLADGEDGRPGLRRFAGVLRPQKRRDRVLPLPGRGLGGRPGRDHRAGHRRRRQAVGERQAGVYDPHPHLRGAGA